MDDEPMSVASHTVDLVEERRHGRSLGIVLLDVGQVALAVAPVSFGLFWLFVSLALASGVGGTLLGVAVVGRFLGQRVLARKAVALLDEITDRPLRGDGGA